MSTTRQLAYQPTKLLPTLAQAAAAYLHAGTAALASWLRHRRERHQLAGLDDQLLRDLGLTRGDVAREYDRPFWQPVDYGRLDAARRRSGPRLGGDLSEAETSDSYGHPTLLTAVEADRSHAPPFSPASSRP